MFNFVLRFFFWASKRRAKKRAPARKSKIKNKNSKTRKLNVFFIKNYCLLEPSALPQHINSRIDN